MVCKKNNKTGKMICIKGIQKGFVITSDRTTYTTTNSMSLERKGFFLLEANTKNKNSEYKLIKFVPIK